eukprot:170424_1
MSKLIQAYLDDHDGIEPHNAFKLINYCEAQPHLKTPSYQEARKIIDKYKGNYVERKSHPSVIEPRQKLLDHDHMDDKSAGSPRNSNIEITESKDRSVVVVHSTDSVTTTFENNITSNDDITREYFSHGHIGNNVWENQQLQCAAWSACLFCCFIPGVLAVTFARQARSARLRNDDEAYQRSSRRAKIWITVSFVIGVILYCWAMFRIFWGLTSYELSHL